MRGNRFDRGPPFLVEVREVGAAAGFDTRYSPPARVHRVGSAVRLWNDAVLAFLIASSHDRGFQPADALVSDDLLVGCGLSLHPFERP